MYASVAGVPLKKKKEWVNSNMELLPHTHFIFLFAVVGNDRNGSNRLCSSNFSGQQNWKRRIDSLHYPVWFCNYRFHGRYRSQWIHFKMIFHESIDATFFFLAEQVTIGYVLPTMSSSFEMASLALPEISGFVAESMRFSSR